MFKYILGLSIICFIAVMSYQEWNYMCVFGHDALELDKFVFFQEEIFKMAGWCS